MWVNGYLQPPRDLRINGGAHQLRRELGMRRKTVKPSVWTKPEIKQLGRIKDVAGAQGAGTQGSGAKT